MLHEHERQDREAFVSVAQAAFRGANRDSYGVDVRADGPYDYASVMHYRYGIVTVPPGMLVWPTGRLSQGDIDGVARLYGSPLSATTLSTNPPGLQLLVDGERVVTPASFDWSQGSSHSLSAPLAQTVGRERFVFGRWNDDSDRERTIIADAGSTWIEANYIVQSRLVTCADPSDAGGVGVRPESPDGYYTLNSSVELEAMPRGAGAHHFMGWRHLGPLSGTHGLAANPVSDLFRRVTNQSPGAGSWRDVVAEFSQEQIFVIDSNVAGSRILLNEEFIRAPHAIRPDRYPNGVTIQAPEQYPQKTTDTTDSRLVFNGWSDGGDRIHKIDVPASGGRVSLNVTQQHRLRARSRTSGGSELVVTPEATDGFHASGTQVQLTAVPAPGEHFAGWVGDASGLAPEASVVLDSHKYVEAVFTDSQPLQSGASEDVALESGTSFRLYAGSSGYNTLAPPDAVELDVHFQASTAGADVHLYVSRGRDPRVAGTTGEDAPQVRADFASVSAGPGQRIVIDRRSTPPLANDVYHIGLAVPPGQGSVRGTLRVEVRRSGLSQAIPNAFTFVSTDGIDPRPQTLRLEHLATEEGRYRIIPDQDWLRADPQEWALNGPRNVEVQVSANSTGLSPGPHRGKLTIVRLEDRDVQTGGNPVGVEVPVALTVIPGFADDSLVLEANWVVIASRPQSGDTYKAGDAINLRVEFSSPIELTGTPSLAIAVGDNTREASLRGIQRRACGNLSHLAFQYIVRGDDMDADGVGVGTDALVLNGGTIAPADGSPAILDLVGAAIGTNAEHRVDGRTAAVPTVRRAEISSSPADGTAYRADERILALVAFTTPIEVTGRPQLALRIGGRMRQASFFSVSTGGNALFFRYDVRPDDVDTDGISIAADALTLSGGTISNPAGAEAELDLGEHAIADHAGHQVDGRVAATPRVRRAEISSSPADGTAYRADEQILARVAFTTPIEVTGRPQLALTIGGRMRQASFSSVGTSGNALFFRYDVRPDDIDTDGISIAADALTLSGGTISSLAGAEAELDLGEHAIADHAGHRVDGGAAAVPTVRRVGIRSRPSDGRAYRSVERIIAWVAFTTTVQVTGRPQLALAIGSRRRQASFFARSTSGNALFFRYTVGPSDLDADGISIAADALTLNGGTIKSPAGVSAELGLGGHAIADDTVHRVNGGGG